MIEAGVIGVKAGWDDTEARAAAQKYATDMKALMASVGGGGPAPAGGGFFNRVSGGGQVAGASPAGGGGNLRLPSFEAEGAQLRGGMLALSRAMFTQANALNTMTGTLRGATAAAPSGGTGPATSGDDSAANNSLLKGFGRKFAALFAVHQLLGLAGAAQTQSVSNQSLDRQLNLGDFGSAIDSQLAEAKSLRSGVGGWARYLANPVWKFFGSDRFDDDAKQQQLERAQLIYHATAAQDKGRVQIREIEQHNEVYGLGAYRASKVHAAQAITNANIQAQVYKDLADKIATEDPAAARSLIATHDRIQALGGDTSAKILGAAEQQAHTIGFGLRFGIDVQREENKLHPGQAHAIELFAHASESIRAMLINSSPANAELARQLGIEQLTGDRIQTIMSGRGSSFDPTAELVGPQFGSGSEQVADILKRIEDLLQKLTSESLGDLGETNNPN